MESSTNFLLPESGPTPLDDIFEHGKFTLRDVTKLLKLERRLSGQLGEHANVLNHSFTMAKEAQRNGDPHKLILYCLFHDIEEIIYRDQTSSVKHTRLGEVKEYHDKVHKDKELLLKFTLRLLELPLTTFNKVEMDLVKTYDGNVFKKEMETFKRDALFLGMTEKVFDRQYQLVCKDSFYTFKQYHTTSIEDFIDFAKFIARKIKNVPKTNRVG